MFKKFNHNALPRPLHLNFPYPQVEDEDYDISLVSQSTFSKSIQNTSYFQRTGRFFRFYDVRGLHHSAENIDRDRSERDGERKYEGNIDFKSSGSSLNI